MEIKNKVIHVIAESCNNDVRNVKEIIKFLEVNDDLTKLKLSSLSFIKLLVALEITFSIEFGDKFLNVRKFKSLQEICNLIEELSYIDINKNNGLGETL